MFETHASSEIPVPPELAASGERMWPYVHLRLHIPWLHVVYEARDAEGVGHRRVLFLLREEQLLDLSKQQDFRLVQVDLVTPPYMNGSTRWKMEPLLEIRTGVVPGTKPPQQDYVYVVDGPKRYSMASSDARALRDEQVVLRI